jgi:hypothetical protein
MGCRDVFHAEMRHHEGFARNLLPVMDFDAHDATIGDGRR